MTLDDVRQAVAEERVKEMLLPVDHLLREWPAFQLSEQAWHDLKNGRPVWLKTDGVRQGRVRLLAPEGTFAAIGELAGKADMLGRMRCQPKRRFMTV